MQNEFEQPENAPVSTRAESPVKMKLEYKPGKTPAQRRVLDEIGCGNHSPIARDSTIIAMLRDGLIEELSPRQLSDRFGIMIIRQFEMPIPIHMAWCDAMSALMDNGEE